MKCALFVLIQALLAPSAHADSGKYSVRDILPEIQKLPATETCLHDFIQRRNQLAVKLGLSPLSIAGEEAGGFLAGAATAKAIIASGAATGEMADLAALAAGLELGIFAGTAASIATVTTNIVKLKHVNRVIKIIYDARNGGGVYLRGFFDSWKGGFPEDSSEVEMATKIADLDRTRKLCDGTFARTGFLVREKKLKNRITGSPARLSDAINASGNLSL